MAFGHLLQHLDEKANLNLCALLEKRIEGRSPLCFAQYAKPLLNSTHFILEVLIRCRCGHLFQQHFVLINVGEPCLSSLVKGVRVGILALLKLAKIHFRCWPDASAREGRAGVRSHVGRSAKVMAGTNGTR